MFPTYAGMAAAQDVQVDAMEQGNLLETTARAAALSAIPFGIATLGMLVCADSLINGLRLSATFHRLHSACSWWTGAQAGV